MRANIARFQKREQSSRENLKDVGNKKVRFPANKHSVIPRTDSFRDQRTFSEVVKNKNDKGQENLSMSAKKYKTEPLLKYEGESGNKEWLSRSAVLAYVRSSEIIPNLFLAAFKDLWEVMQCYLLLILLN